MTLTIHPVILCGGAGTRLWPLSTPQTPKQFLALTSAQSMIEATAGRFSSTQREDLDFTELLVVGSKRHRDLLKKQLPSAKMILEPMGRNSAPAVAAACLVHDSDDLILILPADHDIRDVAAFHDAIAVAAEAALAGAIVTFGIQPTHPATGYGYIQTNTTAITEDMRTLDVSAFVEKPDLDIARSYLEAGTYFWNAGIFLFKAGVMLEALETFAPDVVTGTSRALGDTEADLIELATDAFSATPSISIDFAVMEKATNVRTVPVSMGWSDVGGYRALHELLTGKESENYLSGPVHVQNSSGVYVRSEGPTISVNGVSDLVIVATDGEVMITPKDDDAAVKALGKAVQNNGSALGLSSAVREKAQAWLWTAFETWSQKAWDQAQGGFVEQLDMSGAPDPMATRRVRVQARQIYCFSKAIELGWPKPEAARRLVAQGIEYIDQRLRHAEGGFVHLVDRNGHTVDDRRDLYDHAFLILAGSAAFKSTGNQTALRIADDALAYINDHLKDDEHGGWFESSRLELPRRANPHMHLLEAMLEYYAATGSDRALEHAAEIVRLFETKFFNPAIDVMGEYFNSNWTSETRDSATVFEPGHHYEWAALLYQFDQVADHDSLSWRRRLIRFADKFGLNPETGFAQNALQVDGTQINGDSRLWHQLEMFRAYLMHPDIVARPQAESIFHAILDTYLDAGPEGGWLDEISHNGSPKSTSVPASMLYHLVTAFAILIPPIGT